MIKWSTKLESAQISTSYCINALILIATIQNNEYINQQNLIILNAIKKKSLSEPNLYSTKKDDDKKIIITNEKQVKVSKNMSLSNFNKHLDKIIQDTQPKKFISKRSFDKKQLTDSTNIIDEKNIIEFKRQLNPRLPPYFQIHSRFKKD